MSNPFNDQVAKSIEPNGSIDGPIAKRKEAAKRIGDAGRDTALVIVQLLNDGLGKFWGAGGDLQKLADEIDIQFGTGFTLQLFVFHRELGEFIAERVPDLAKSIQKVPAGYTVTNDGPRVIITESK